MHDVDGSRPDLSGVWVEGGRGDALDEADDLLVVIGRPPIARGHDLGTTVRSRTGAMLARVESVHGCLAWVLTEDGRALLESTQATT